MSKVSSYFIISFFSICLIIIGLFLRLYKLDSVPYGLTNDNVGAYYASSILMKTGKNFDGVFLPRSFQLDNSFSAGFVYFYAPFTMLLPKSPFAVRFPAVLASLIAIWLLYKVAYNLFNNRNIALLSAVVLSVSPWHIHMNRGAYDGPISLFVILFLYALLLFIRYKNILPMIIAFPLAYYVYHPIKIFLLAFIPFISINYLQFLFSQKRKVFLFGIVFFVTVISFFVVIKQEGVNRQEVLLWSNQSNASSFVNWERTVNLAPQFMRVLFSNKVTYYGFEIASRYMDAFSFNRLFISGEGGIYGTYRHGFFYLIELGFFIVGLYYLVTKRTYKESIIVLGGLFIAPLPTAFSSDFSMALRSISMLPFMSIIIGCGMFYLTEYIGTFRRFSVPITTLIFLGYMFSVIAFGYLYFYRYSVYGAEYYFSSNREVIEYVTTKKDSYDSIHFVNTGPMFLFQYAFFSDTTMDEVLVAWKSEWPKSLGKIKFINDCDTSKLSLQPKEMYIAPTSCFKETTPSATIVDKAEPLRVIWNIFER